MAIASSYMQSYQVCMDNGNLAWLDYSVPARRFREQYPLHERGVAIQM